MKYKPIKDRVLVEPYKAETKTDTVIYLPDSAQQKPLKGVVVAVGTKVEEVKTKDIVIYKQFGPVEIKIDGVAYMHMKEDDIILIE